MPTAATRSLRGQHAKGFPYAMRFADGRTLAVEIPSEWVVTDRSGEVGFTPAGMRHLDRLRSLFTPLKRTPTPSFLRTLRQALKLTQTEFGARAGVDKLTVAKWERGELRPNEKSMRAIRAFRAAATKHGVLLAG